MISDTENIYVNYMWLIVCRNARRVCRIMYFCTHVVLYSIHTAFHRAVLHCTVPYCTVRHCTVPHCTILFCTVLYCTVLYCTVLYCILPQYSVI